MSKSRAPLYGGLAAFAGIGYYLYQAGGDASKAGDKIRGISSFFLSFSLDRRFVCLQYMYIEQSLMNSLIQST